MVRISCTVCSSRLRSRHPRFRTVSSSSFPSEARPIHHCLPRSRKNICAPTDNNIFFRPPSFGTWRRSASSFSAGTRARNFTGSCLASVAIATAVIGEEKEEWYDSLISATAAIGETDQEWYDSLMVGKHTKKEVEDVGVSLEEVAFGSSRIQDQMDDERMLEGRARNVMLQRFQSVNRRDLESKYSCDFKTLLGKGAYGTVHLAHDRSTGKKVAVKKMSKVHTNSTSFCRERYALLRIYDIGGHANISSLRDMYEDATHFYLIFDLVDGPTMFDFLIKGGSPFSEKEAAPLIRQVTSALAFLHGSGIVHADLKPENIMLSTAEGQPMVVKLVDFGCAAGISPNDAESDLGAPAASGSNIIGTTAYSPPDALTCGEEWEASASTDMWSLGVIIFIMLTGSHPYDLEGDASDKDIERRLVEDAALSLGMGVTEGLSASATDLIRQLMMPDPEKRLTAEQVLVHPWIQTGK
mmetsp:Transcript_11851/g.25979  ORF Transcript_11851/g.25979 Transcript_11851/m.25979 type:complete len:469 (-) Transcript_11851:150-1556(-)